MLEMTKTNIYNGKKQVFEMTKASIRNVEK